MQVERKSFVIVGAGLAGAATAFHLREAGVTDLVILEREHVPGVHASGRNAAILRRRMDSPELQPLADESAPVLAGGALAPFNRCGGFLIGRGDEPASARIPRACGTGRFVAEDGVIDVAALLQRYLRGVEVRYLCVVEGAVPTADGWSIETTAGPLRANTVVNAAGPWAGTLFDLRLTPLNRHLFLSAVDASVDPLWPWLWDGDAGYYLRPESGGLLLSACDETPAPPGDYRDDPAVLEDLYRKLARHQPEMDEPRIVRHWVGQRTFAPDRLPVIGYDALRPHLFHVAGLGGHGVTLSYAVGRIAARALLGGPPPPASLDPARLAQPLRSSLT